MAYDNLLTLMGQFFPRTGIQAAPTAVVSSQDDTIQQALALLNEGVEELGTMEWGPVEAVYSFNYTAPGVVPPVGDVTLYEALNLQSVPDMLGMAFDTLYNTATRIPVNGPISEPDWQTMVTLQISSAQYAFRFYRTSLYIYPYPTVGQPQNFTFRYKTTFIVLDTTGGPPGIAKPRFTLDTDFCIIPSHILLQDLRYRWKSEKGLDATKELNLRNGFITRYMNKNPNAGVVDMGDPMPGDSNSLVGPGLLIAAGSTIPVPP